MSEQTSPPLEVVPVQFATSTGDVHIDRAIELAARSASLKVAHMLAGALMTAMKRELEVYDKYPAPKYGAVLNRGTCIDKVCECGRVVTFPLHESPEPDPLADHPELPLSPP